MQALGAAQQQPVFRAANPNATMVKAGLRGAFAGTQAFGPAPRAAHARMPASVTRSVLEINKQKAGSGSNGNGKGADASELASDILRHSKYTVGANPDAVTPKQAYQATAYSVAEKLIDAFDATNEHFKCVGGGRGAWGARARVACLGGQQLAHRASTPAAARCSMCRPLAALARMLPQRP